ncbi:MAG: hypothetical protein H6740_13340 [Alphaproteobacteria bacterium]|nr:hypothetical protein [Alphaproteobacteria bacterium]
MLSLLPILLGAPAFAQEPTTVFVSELSPADADAGGIAGLLTYYLLEALDSHPELDAKGADDAPDFGEHSARIYLTDCPRGQEVGCAFVVGDSVHAEYAVTGVVGTLPGGGQQVEVYIVDIAGAREAVHYTIDLGVGDDEAFIGGVKELLLSVIAGEEGLVEDIRAMGGVEEETRIIDPELAGKELDDLRDEMGDSGLDTRSDRQVQRGEGYDMDDLAEDMESDATKPWERMGMTPGEYMSFKNSGLTLQKWEELSAGRRFQVIVRPVGGLMRGPVGTRFYGEYAIDPATGAVPEAYQWQTRVGTSAPVGGLRVGFGILPILEVDLGAGVVYSTFTHEVQQFVIDAPNTTKEPIVERAANLAIDARVLAVLMPTRAVHPVAGGGVSVVLSPSLASLRLLDGNTQLYTPPSASTVIAQAIGGVDITVLQNPSLDMDLYAHVPIGVAVGGRLEHSDRYGTGAYLTSSPQPTDPGAFSAGLEVGVSLRFLGGAKARTPFDEFEDEPL